MIVGLAGAIISVAALAVSSLRPSTGRLLVAMVLLVMHVGACIAYFYYAQTYSADTATYYFDRYGISQRPFALGTVFTVEMTQFLRIWFGAGYFECFLFFQSIGFLGIMILMRTFQEIEFRMNAEHVAFPTVLVFLPSVHFWTSAIGKDAPVFFAVSLCVWCMLNLRKRIYFFAFSLLIMLLFRPHVALVAVISTAGAAALHPGLSFGRKFGLLSVSFAGGAFLARSVGETLSVDVTSAGDLIDFTGSVGEGSNLRESPFPIRLASLLFRPFFFDAKDMFGLVTSFENLGSLMLVLYFFIRWRDLTFLRRRVFFIQYCVVFSVILIILLALIYYNVGLGLRQRVMVFPPLFSVFTALWAMPRVQSERTFEPGEPLAAARQATVTGVVR